ncbi:MAG TPA: bifunctional adenosylcobinamide kinase/adenosylcobinamide-phosphate guanylyltransferase [Vicinamibacteria bacterium]|nr:bifunctional adenosylcobinamide kinase/adenosylcobinamide-phosphate guanylyltransferase [Vicinamibacteria bacterium]
MDIVTFAMLTLVLGGARSGKSRYARSLWDASESVVFVATATASDSEMVDRIERHRAERPSHWKTIEEPLDVVAALAEQPEGTAVLLDCVTLWISNLLCEHRDRSRNDRERLVLEALKSLTKLARGRNLVVVSNEVGSGLVPESTVAREFRDLQGLANQFIAREADRVVLVVAGLPVEIR